MPVLQSIEDIDVGHSIKNVIYYALGLAGTAGHHDLNSLFPMYFLWMCDASNFEACEAYPPPELVLLLLTETMQLLWRLDAMKHLLHVCFNRLFF